MPRACTVCTHKKITYINKALLSGETVSSVAVKYGLSRSSVDRHKKKCIASAVNLARKKIQNKEYKKKEKKKDKRTIENQKAVEVRELSAGQKMVNKLESLEKDAREIQIKATKKGNYQAALAAIKEQSRIFDIYIHIAAELNKQNKSELEEIRESWDDVKEILLDMFAKYPKAGDYFEERISSRLAQHW